MVINEQAAAKTEKRWATIFALIGLGMILIGIITVYNHFNFKKTAIETTAVIKDIQKSGSGRNKTHTVYIEYTADGTVYNEVLGYYSSGMRVGKEITIMYDPANPKEITLESEVRFLVIMLLALGGLFFAIGGGLITYRKRQDKHKNELLNNGRVIEAKIQDVCFNTRYSVRGVHPYIIYCHYVDAYGKEYIFQSENIWYNVKYIITEKNIETLNVHIDKSNMNKYYVSLRKIETFLKPN